MALARFLLSSSPPTSSPLIPKLSFPNPSLKTLVKPSLPFAPRNGTVALPLRASHVGPLQFSPKTVVGYLDLGSQWKMAAGAMSKWVELYYNVLLVRVLLSWFPNIPWDRQPFPALRSLCDPYLSLFSKVVPPVFGLDVSPLLAFAVLNFAMAVLGSTPGI